MTDDDIADFKGTVAYDPDTEEVASLTFIKDGGTDVDGNEYSLKTTIVCDPAVTGDPTNVVVDTTTNEY